MAKLTEGDVEAATLEWFEQLNYSTLHASEIAPDEPNAERQDYADTVRARLYEIGDCAGYVVNRI
jgi:type I restriction enzyme, R subunit